MAWYDIKYKCGHSERRQVYGPTNERNRKIEWYETQVCLDCWKKEQGNLKTIIYLELYWVSPENNHLLVQVCNAYLFRGALGSNGYSFEYNGSGSRKNCWEKDIYDNLKKVLDEYHWLKSKGWEINNAEEVEEVFKKLNEEVDKHTIIKNLM